MLSPEEVVSHQLHRSIFFGSRAPGPRSGAVTDASFTSLTAISLVALRYRWRKHAWF
jgi:hypothetical protein